MEATEARRLLGVRPSAGSAELKAAFRRSARLHHPDHGGHSDHFRAVHQAFCLLKAIIPVDPVAPRATSYRFVSIPTSSRVWDEKRRSVVAPTQALDFADLLASEMRKLQTI